MRWSLESLYSSFDSEQFQRDFAIVDEQMEMLKNWVTDNLSDYQSPQRKLEEVIGLIKEYYTNFSRLMGFCHLSLSVNTKDEKALFYLDKLQFKSTELTSSIVKIEKWIGGLENLEEVIETSPLLKEHNFYLKEIARKTKYLLSEEAEVIIAKMVNTGSQGWSKLQDKLTSTLLVDMEVNGEKKQLPLPVVRNMAHDKDPKVRKAAYYAELKSYEKIVESSAACLNGIKGEVITLAKLRGYSSPLEKTLLDSRMDQETLDAMLEGIKEALPNFHKYYRQKAKLLGYQEGLPFYELFAPLGEVKMEFTFEEARKFIVKHFRTFSDKLADFTDMVFEKKWIDAEIREGKRGGAFCSNLQSIKESRILTNFSGSLSDVTTLAHELGHAYHGYCLKDESILNTSYPMPLAETASIFNEAIVMNAALKEATDEEKLTILETVISDAGQVIVDIYSRYLFETELFKRREDHNLSVNELKEIMLEAQKEAYGDGLDHNYLHPYMWVCKPHYYYAARNFYNFPYAFGLLFAKGIYAQYLKEGKDFIPKYDQLLAVTGKMNIKDVGAVIGIDVTSKEFWKSSLELIIKDIEEFIKLSS
ncbi:M3 family oligoendopeptidase [Anaerobranca gottschalkii]|uniref:Oligoendopeptidase, pepF/M3 family n=1 Tax=Anaerobranca gottschalkii DSM 13577 TaxID=1120990 RepID=A0A1I0ADZ6_9FIRM|nr:M3 family oligoendopeptidase [Anaerobranca gottschalkii]SES92311.1 oligoendopeptidase, pepF/M3 family [Anaerobranca gottschalkii DSM 13577]